MAPAPRPVRETMGITSGVSNLPSLFWGTLAVTLLTQPIFGWLTSRFRRTVFLPWVYGFFALNLLGFYLWFRFESEHIWIARAFLQANGGKLDATSAGEGLGLTVCIRLPVPPKDSEPADLPDE